MNWTSVQNDKDVIASRQYRGNRHVDMSNSIEALCTEIESLARYSTALEVQYKSIIQYYQGLAKQVVATA